MDRLEREQGPGRTFSFGLLACVARSPRFLTTCRGTSTNDAGAFFLKRHFAATLPPSIA